MPGEVLSINTFAASEDILLSRKRNVNAANPDDELMKTPPKRLLFWTPRILTILFAGFISVFALDVFDEGFGFWQTIPALLIHLIPTWILLVVLVMSWRWEWVGGILFNALGAFYPIMFWGRVHWLAHLIISGPLFLIGMLFLLNWRYRTELRSTQPRTLS